MESINISEFDFDSVIDDTEEQLSWNRDSESIHPNTNQSIDISQSPLICISFIIIIMILTLQIYIGWYYFDACPISPLIPHYLIVAGTASLAVIFLFFFIRIIVNISAKITPMNTIDRTNSNRTIIILNYGLYSAMFINFTLLIFLIVWTIIGWVWVILVWHRVQYRRPGADNYCHSLLYQFSFSFLLLTTTFKLVFICCIHKKLYSRICGYQQKKDILTSDEP